MVKHTPAHSDPSRDESQPAGRTSSGHAGPVSGVEMMKYWNVVAQETAAFLRGRLYGAHDGAGVQRPEDADTSGGGIAPSPPLRQAWEFMQEALEQAQHEA